MKMSLLLCLFLHTLPRAMRSQLQICEEYGREFSVSCHHHRICRWHTTFSLLSSIRFPLQHQSLTKWSTTWSKIQHRSLTTTHSARNLGFIFDEHLTFSDQITALSKSCYYHIRELRCIRPYLHFKTTSTIATSIVHSKLDYCNYLYHNLPNCQLNRLQQTRNSLAHAVVKAPINPLISLPFSNLSTG